MKVVSSTENERIATKTLAFDCAENKNERGVVYDDLTTENLMKWLKKTKFRFPIRLMGMDAKVWITKKDGIYVAEIGVWDWKNCKMYNAACWALGYRFTEKRCDELIKFIADWIEKHYTNGKNFNGFENEKVYKQVMEWLNHELNCETLMVTADDDSLMIYVDGWRCGVDKNGVCYMELEPTKHLMDSTDCENLSAIVRWANYLHRTAFGIDDDAELPF